MPVAAPVQPLTDEQRAEQAARRERWLLLKAFESSPLTKANFCVLKRIAPDALDAQLAQAKAEAAEWAAAHPRPPEAPRGEGRPEHRGDGRGEGRPQGRPGGRPGDRGDRRPHERPDPRRGGR